MNEFNALELDAKIIKAVEEAGFSKPTSIQEKVIPIALDGYDVLGSAATGTGKTAAFLLPALQFLIDYPRRKQGPPRILVMVPTRELAYQVHEQAVLFSKHMEVKSNVITGGINYEEHTEALEKSSDILIATPGRLMEYLDTDQFDPNAIQILIVDEADRMLDMGFINDMLRITEVASRRQQTMLLSATLDSEGVTNFAEKILDNAVNVQATPSTRESGKINQWINLCDDRDHKNKLLVSILNEEQNVKSIIFVKTKERVNEVSSFLQSQGITAVYIQGNMAQDRRNAAMSKFANDEVNVLVATDVAARGIDIADISHIINYDLPRTSEIYVHRIGRTARGGKKGTAISLIEAHDMPQLARIERFTEQKLRRRVVQGLRPNNKEAKLPGKKKVKLSAKQKKLVAGKAKKRVKQAAKRKKITPA